MEEKIVFCKGGGCTAKLGAGILQRVLDRLPRGPLDRDLLVGFDSKDDAAVYRVTDDIAIVQTLDFFPPMVDDPYTFGRIAAANALSDVYAMGGEVKTALNIVCFPEKMDLNVLGEIMRGGSEKVIEAGGTLAGGHSIADSDVKYGLSVTGIVHPDRIYHNNGGRAGDKLILTKPLGVGIVCTAARVGEASREALDAAVASMTTLYKYAAACCRRYDVHACTDVTGFGLLGHGLEMAQGSGVELEIRVGAVDFIPEAAELAKMGVLPEGMYRNRAFAESSVDPGGAETWQQDLLYDPQTSGGLLMAVDPADAEALLEELNGCVPSAQRLGDVREYRGGKRIFLK